MYNSGRTKNPYLKQIIANSIYVVLAVMIIICGFFSLIKGEEGRKFYPVVFMLASALNFTDGIPRLFTNSRNKKKKLSGVFLCFMGVILLVISAVIAYTLW